MQRKSSYSRGYHQKCAARSVAREGDAHHHKGEGGQRETENIRVKET